MKQVVFLADFFSTDLIGGAELNDSVLLDGLISRGVKVIKLKTSDLTDEDVIKNDLFIVSNFVNLSERHKNMVMLKKYIIYEHDHKYVSNRNPAAFPDFKVPKEHLINVEFYKNAHAVVVLSDVCKTVIEDCLGIDNVINIGCSLWSTDKLDFISEIDTSDKNGKYCIINSSNPIKGTQEAIAFCNKNNLDYELIGPLPERELLEKLAKYDFFVFIPHVLETLSRVVVEAKMLNCKVLTSKKLIGAASEPWYDLMGTDLIRTIRNCVDAAINTFVDLLKDDTITVILNCYRRPENLEDQIKSIRNQSVSVKQIWIWVNHHEDNADVDFSSFDVDRVIKNDYNWKFYGRFAGAMLVDTKYVALFDDDTIPGPEWFENCLQTMETSEGILGGAGVILDGSKYTGHKRFGWSSQNEDIVEVDLVGHAWFFKREWLKYLWMEKPFTWDNGEDIQFSYCCQKFGGINTFCPPHPKDKPSFSSSLRGYELGVDEKATSKARNHSVFYAQRDACVKNAIINGWKPLFRR